MKRLSWTSIAIMVGLPALLGFVGWLIHILSAPDRWCGVQVTGDKIASRPIADCTNIVLQLIHWLGLAQMGLIACICIAFLTIVARDLGAALSLKGPQDTSVTIGGDPIPQAQVTTTTTVATPPAPDQPQ